MFDVKERDCITVQEKLLYNIFEAVQGAEKPQIQLKDKPDKSNGPIGKCPICGKEWGNNGQRLACVRKHKKEGLEVGKNDRKS